MCNKTNKIYYIYTHARVCVCDYVCMYEYVCIYIYIYLCISLILHEQEQQKCLPTYPLVVIRAPPAP